MTMIVEPTETITLFKKYRTKGAAFSTIGVIGDRPIEWGAAGAARGASRRQA